MLRAVIFDFDGVITDSEILHLRAYNKVLEKYSFEISTKDFYKEYLGFTDFDCFKLLMDQGLIKISMAQITDLIKQKNKIFEELAKSEGQTIEGVLDFLKMLEQNKIPMAICSGALLTEIELILKEAKLRHFFTAIVSAEQVKKGKPHPEGFLLTLQKLNEVCHPPLAAAECVIIEDSRWGLQAAKVAGMHTIAVTNSYDVEQLIMAEKVVSSLTELNIRDLKHLCT